MAFSFQNLTLPDSINYRAECVAMTMTNFCLRNEIKIHSIFITCDPQMYVNLKHRTHYTGEDLNTWYIGVPLLVDRRLTHLAKLTQKILAIHLDRYTTDTFGKHCHHRSHLQSIVSFNVTTIGNRTARKSSALLFMLQPILLDVLNLNWTSIGDK